MNIHVGDEIELTEEVVPENTAEKWGSGSLPVYATPAMISLIEQSAVNLLAGRTDYCWNKFKHCACFRNTSWWNDQMSLFLNRDRPQTSGIPCRSN